MSWLSTAKWFALGILLAALGLVIFYDYRERVDLSQQNTKLNGEKAVLTSQLNEQRAATDSAVNTISQFKDELRHFQGTVDRMVDVQQSAAREIRRLNDLFAQHDLGELARVKPGLLEHRIDAGSESARRLLECASGSAADYCRATGAQPAAKAGSPAAPTH